MARPKKDEGGTLTDDIQPVAADETPAPADEIDPRDAEIAALKAKLAAIEQTVSADLTGGRFMVSIKDGPTATIETKIGESPVDKFFSQLGIHSCPHRPVVTPAAPDAKIGLHYGNSVKPFHPQSA